MRTQRTVVMSYLGPNRNETPPPSEDAPAIEVVENVRLPVTYTDARLEMGCDPNTLASRSAPFRITGVDIVTPSTGCEWANDAANEVPVAAVHSKAPVRKNAPREKYPVDPYTRAAPARNSRLIGAAQWARDSANSAPRISVTPLTAIPRPVSFPFGLTSASFALI